MSRLNINFPWIWNSLSGQQPASNLDDDYNAVPAGDITIRTKIKTGSYTLINDDEYSFILCRPVLANMTLTPPTTPPAGWSFFWSDQSTNSKTVQLIASVTVDGVPQLNPIFPTATITGGLMVYDGSTWSMFTRVFRLD